MNIWTSWLLARRRCHGSEFNLINVFCSDLKPRIAVMDAVLAGSARSPERNRTLPKALVRQSRAFPQSSRVWNPWSQWHCDSNGLVLDNMLTWWLIDALRVELGFKNLNRVASVSVLSPWRRQELRLILHDGVWFAVQDGSNSFSSQIW